MKSLTSNLTLIEPDDGCCYCTDSPLTDDGDLLDVTTPSPNGINDDGNNPVTCKEYQFGCSNRNQCIEYSSMCDGVTDCNDGSDEKYCDECLMTSWSDWSKCSLSCGVGIRVKSRKISINNRKIENCENVEFEDVESCHVMACPLDNKWLSWSAWSSCNQPCDGGSRTRTRDCGGGKNGGEKCIGEKLQTQLCNEEPCSPTEGCFGNKTLITADCINLCPATCIELSQETACVSKCSNQNAQITGCFCRDENLLQDGICVPKSDCRCFYQGKEYPKGNNVIDGCNCRCNDGIMNCETDCELQTACIWSQWSKWSDCSVDRDCKKSYLQHRFRSALPGSALTCTGESSISRPCPSSNDPTSGSGTPCKGEWTDWDKSCDLESEKEDLCEPKLRLKSIGHNDTGYHIEDCCPAECDDVTNSCDKCYFASCKALQFTDNVNCLVHQHKKCGASEQDCSCPEGKFYRDNNCVDQHECGCFTENGDVIETGDVITAECNECQCVGGSFQCTKIPGCQTEGDWAEWSSWSICSSTCLGANSHPLKTRHRECRPRSIFYQKWLVDGVNPICQGQPLETKDCDLQVLCDGIFQWSSWTAWSTCKFCSTTRSRTCLYQRGESQTQVDNFNCEGHSGQSGPNQVASCPCTAEDCPNGTDWVSLADLDGDDVTKCSELGSSDAFREDSGSHMGHTCVCHDVNQLLSGSGNCVQRSECNCLIRGKIIQPGRINSKNVDLNTGCSNECDCVEGEVICSQRRCSSCVYSSWSQWSSCDRTCGVGRQVRLKVNIFKNPKCDKKSVYQSRDCNIKPCGSWDRNQTSWSDWGTCSASCDGGIRHRYFFDSGDSNDTKEKRENIQTEVCNEKSCDQFTIAKWAEWSDWSKCSITCGSVGGVISRHRECIGSESFGKCQGPGIEQRLCTPTHPCTEDTLVCPNGTEYSECGLPCMHTCLAVENCMNPSESNCKSGCFCPDGKIFDEISNFCVSPGQCHCQSPKTGKIMSAGEVENYDDCNQCRCVSGRVHCTDYDCSAYKKGTWCPWSAWTPCSASCGQQRRSRIKTCSCPPPTKGTNLGCETFNEKRGDELLMEEESECHIYPVCPRDGGYSDWTEWTSCDCETLQTKRERLCDSPTPFMGGKYCQGHSTEYKSCDPKECDKSCPVGSKFKKCIDCKNTCADLGDYLKKLRRVLF